MHSASYIRGCLGGIVLCVYVRVSRVSGPSFIDAGRGSDVFNGRANLNVLAGARREVGFE